MLLAEIGDHRVLGWAVHYSVIKDGPKNNPSHRLGSISGRRWGKALMEGKPLHELSNEERLAAIASLEIGTLRMYQALRLWSQLSQQHRLARIFTLIIQDEYKHHLSAWHELISIMGVIEALALFGQWEIRKLYAFCSFVRWR